MTISGPDRAADPVQPGRQRPIVCCFGTRPEVIKMFPVIERLRQRGISTVLLHTGQHRSLADEALSTFGLEADIDLDVMQPRQEPTSTASRILARAPAALDQIDPGLVVVQGDTTSALAMALAGAYRGLDVAHIEAGLRSHDRRNPFPEELNRELIATAATWHFAPTTQARANLLRTGVDPASVVVVGNTIVDTQRWALGQLPDGAVPSIAATLDLGRPLALLTVHRRENWGNVLAEIIGAVRRLATARPDLQVLVPLHPNPVVGTRIAEGLERSENTVVCEPLDYLDLTWVLSRCSIVLTDSGGLQEEAPALGKPVIVLRERTERPEGVEAGLALLVGTNGDRIVRAVLETLDRTGPDAVSLYGDGEASRRIVDVLSGHPTDEFRGSNRVRPDGIQSGGDG